MDRVCRSHGGMGKSSCVACWSSNYCTVLYWRPLSSSFEQLNVTNQSSTLRVVLKAKCVWPSLSFVDFLVCCMGCPYSHTVLILTHTVIHTDSYCLSRSGCMQDSTPLVTLAMIGDVWRCGLAKVWFTFGSLGALKGPPSFTFRLLRAPKGPPSSTFGPLGLSRAHQTLHLGPGPWPGIRRLHRQRTNSRFPTSPPSNCAKLNTSLRDPLLRQKLTKSTIFDSLYVSSSSRFLRVSSLLLSTQVTPTLPVTATSTLPSPTLPVTTASPTLPVTATSTLCTMPKRGRSAKNKKDLRHVSVSQYQYLRD